MSHLIETKSVVHFKNLKCYQQIEQGKQIDVLNFIEVSEQIVNIIETFGRLFAPVVTDMRGNLEKLRKSHQKNLKQFIYIENLLIKDLNPDIKYTADALLWLNRGLQLICIFFSNILNDQDSSENLKHHLQDAYEKTLKKHHNWLIQSTISIIYLWVPKRSELLGKGQLYNDNITSLTAFLPNMQLILTKIDDLLLNLNNSKNKQKK